MEMVLIPKADMDYLESLVLYIKEDRQAKDWQSMHLNISELIDMFESRFDKGIFDNNNKEAYD